MTAISPLNPISNTLVLSRDERAACLSAYGEFNLNRHWKMVWLHLYLRVLLSIFYRSSCRHPLSDEMHLHHRTISQLEQRYSPFTSFLSSKSSRQTFAKKVLCKVKSGFLMLLINSISRGAMEPLVTWACSRTGSQNTQFCTTVHPL